MFYSHEVLTSRKYGVATVWLVATLGAKTNSTKKVSRKAILDVNLKKACTTIMEPEAPMALRLQSNLLFGVSRVYDQQCHYVLQDAQAMQNAIRALIKISRDNQLDAGAGKARPEQLLLLDDPAFMPEHGLPALDFDLDSQVFNDNRSTQSMMSIRGRSGSASSLHAASAIGLNFPSSSNNSVYQLPDNNIFGKSPLPMDLPDLGREEDEPWIQEDDIFRFDEDGNILENHAPSDHAQVQKVITGKLPSDSAASARVRQEHEDAHAGPLIAGEDDFIMHFGDDDGMAVLPDDVEPFGTLPMMTGGLGGDDQPQHHSLQDRVFTEDEISSDSAQAPQVRKRKVKTKRGLNLDKQLELKTTELKLWQVQYVERMRAASNLKDHIKGNALAKKNAHHFVYGAGLNGIGHGVGANHVASPLAMFAGEALLALVTSRTVTGDVVKDRKRKADKPLTSEAKRHESENARGSSRDRDIPLHEEEDGINMNLGDNDQSLSIEVGRDAPSALQDYPSSALMPWNKSASLHSFQRNMSSQHGRGVPGSSTAFNNRLTSASPLVGRGSALAKDLTQFMPEEDEPMFGREDEEMDFVAGEVVSSSRELNSAFRSQVSLSTQEEFEMFGAAANVDTQTAGASQWVRDALDKESNNFLEYVRNTIDEKQDDELDYEQPNRGKYVTFEELFEAETNSRIVAAQAFYHVLSLATKTKVWVDQDVDEEAATGGPLPFGEIRIGVFDAV